MRKEAVLLWLNSVLHRVGVDLRRYPLRYQRALLKYMNDNEIKHCVDVGANTGQFATDFIRAGFRGTLLSFEPQKNAFNILSKKAAAAKSWQVYNIGLGNKNEEAVINVSQNSVSSSIMGIQDIHVNAAPESKFISTEQIKVRRLDDFLKETGINEKIFLKIDAQGYEEKILEGIEGCMNQVYALQLEMACVQLYNGEKLFIEMKAAIEKKGFYLSALETGFTDPQTGRLLQAEAVFLRETEVSKLA